ncbi:MAG: hypothetical protein PHX20_08130 [Candidatus Omnitrophica bacterium]|nr:hypothetical protein [Candidatus Omnitrophota bacterium]
MLLWDGLESNSNWSVNAAGKMALTPAYKTEGNSSLSVNVEGEIPSAHGVIIKKSNANLDVAFANKVILDIYNSGEPCQISLAFETGNYHESVPKTLNSGMNRNVTFEISSKDFKAPFDYASTAKNVMFIVHPNDGSIDPIYFDNIRVKKYGGLKSVPPGISPAVLAAIGEEIPPEVTPEYTGPYSILSGSVPGEHNEVPEHKTAVIFGLGLAGLLFYRKKS